MTSARSSAKRTWNSRIRSLVAAFALSATLAAALPALAAGDNIKLFQRQFMVGGRTPTAVLIVGWERDQKDVEKLMDIVSARANESYARLDWQNPASEVARVNASAGKGPVKVSDDVFAAFQEAKQVSEWTGGAFDIIAEGSGNYKNISLSEGSSSVELKNEGMQARFEPIIDGFMAELMIRYINAANMHNALVKVGNVLRGIGKGLTDSWKMQVQDDAGTFARHALNLTVSNTGIATVSAAQYRAQPLIDPRTRAPAAMACRGVTMVAKDASHAQGLAQAIFLLGPEEGLKMLAKTGKGAGLIVDNDGKFIRTPGFN